jgi:hypothetical protein
MRGRGGGPRALAATVAQITKPVFGRRGFAEGAVLTHWPDIVGPHLAAHTAPERIARSKDDAGTLHLRIDSGALALELQHLEPVIVERINGYFGYRAVARLRLIQGPVAAPPAPKAAPPPRLDAAQEAALARPLSGVEDSDLRARLESLGRAVMGRSAAAGRG